MATHIRGDGVGQGQLKDQALKPIILYLKDGTLPEDSQLAKKDVAESTVYTVCDNVLYYLGSKQMETARVVVS